MSQVRWRDPLQVVQVVQMSPDWLLYAAFIFNGIAIVFALAAIIKQHYEKKNRE